MRTARQRNLLPFLLVTAPAAAQLGWTQLAPALAPAPRVSHATAFDLGRSRTVLFGGWDNHVFGDTWEWSGTAWTRLQTSLAPVGRAEHMMAYDLLRGHILLYGGTQGGGLELDDTWVFAGGVWSPQAPAHAPSHRTSCGLAFDPRTGNMVLFGGGSGPAELDETWTWDGTDWTRQTPPVHPSARFAPALGSDLHAGRVVLFGGFQGGTSLADGWAWDGSHWTPLASAGPVGLRYPSLHYDPGRQMMVLFGGQWPVSLPLPSATWLLAGDDWRQDPRPMPPTLDTRITLDLARDRFVLFGGLFGTAGYVDGTWEYGVGPVALWTAFGSGCAGSVGTPTLRPSQNTLPVLGSTFRLEVVNVAGPLAAFGVGISDRQWHGQTLPLDLAGMGMPGCRLLSSLDATVVVTATAQRATCAVPIPATTSLSGVSFYAQAFAMDATANTLGAVASNGGVVAIGPF